MPRKTNTAYSQILKSSSLIGGAEGINILIGMIRVKFIATLIGPTGLGMLGNFISIKEIFIKFSGLGIKQSGVREIAEAMGAGDEDRIGRAAVTLRRMCCLTGIAGSVLLMGLAWPLSQITFDTHDYTPAIVVLSIVVLLSNIQSGQISIIQGMRQVSYTARINVMGTFVGAVVAVGLYAWLGHDGIVPALVLLAVFNVSLSWYFAHKIPMKTLHVSWAESFQLAGGLIHLGMAFMWNGLMLAMVAYLTRLFITQEIGIFAVGIFGAAFNLSGLVVSFILSSMDADFYPMLTTVNNDPKAMTKLVNEQTEIATLLSAPPLFAALTFAPLIIRIFYTPQFAQAADLLQWFILGCFGRVITFAMTYVVIAKGRSVLYAGIQTALNIAHVLLIWIGLRHIGLIGVPMAYCGLYLLTTIVVYTNTWYLIGFHWSTRVWRLLFIVTPLMLTVFCSSRYLQSKDAMFIGTVITVSVTLFSIRKLSELLGPDHRICKLITTLPMIRLLIVRNRK